MKYRIAVIGTGYMAEKHCSMLKNNNQVVLDTIVSTKKSEKYSKEFIQKYGFKKNSTKLDTVLHDQNIDIAIICSPDYLHAEQTIKLLESGKHVLCEKPLARTKKDFQLVKKTLTKSQKILQVGMNCRFREQYSKAKKIIDDGKLGELRVIHGEYLVNIVDTMKKREKEWWKKYPKNIYPILHGGAIHCIDLIRWNGGKIKRVCARSTSLGLEGLGDDTFLISLEFENGIIGNCYVSASEMKPNSFHIDYSLTKGSIIKNTQIFQTKNNQPKFTKEIVIKQKIIDLRLQFRDMLESIKTEKEPMNSFNEAYENYKLISLIEESIRKDKVINAS